MIIRFINSSRQCFECTDVILELRFRHCMTKRFPFCPFAYVFDAQENSTCCSSIFSSRHEFSRCKILPSIFLCPFPALKIVPSGDPTGRRRGPAPLPLRSPPRPRRCLTHCPPSSLVECPRSRGPRKPMVPQGGGGRFVREASQTGRVAP